MADIKGETDVICDGNSNKIKDLAKELNYRKSLYLKELE